MGRSPRVRGSLINCRKASSPSGSIPACAGEPKAWPGAQTRFAVDPRVCGGAPNSAAFSSSHSGRSPRVRGSPMYRCHHLPPLRSIPACAGEPLYGLTINAVEAVDPRVCGGAFVDDTVGISTTGRSPRVRGSRRGRRGRRRRRRSIPACAGEPPCVPVVVSSVRVDPRVCGGAAQALPHSIYIQGRSPRVRGSRPDGRCSLPGGGSIPACAGEPC